MNVANITFLFTAVVVILLMTPALAFFYGGLARKEFTTTMLMQTFFAIPLITLVWAILGFSLAYGDSLSGFIGGFDFVFLKGIMDETNNIWAPTVPFNLFFMVQVVFAIITPALIVGALIGRLRFRAYLLFMTFWSLLVYSPLIHWVWGGGFLVKLNYIDFAGGLPIHGIAGFSALAAVFALGNREKQKDGPSNLMYVAIGVGILWAGWLIFNASGALAAGETAALAALNTLVSSASGAVAWLLLAYRQNKIITLTDVMFGAFSGLVVATPTCGFVSPWVMFFAGFLGGLACYGAISWRIKRNWDDTLDVWGLHGIGGLVGVLILGFCANPNLAPVAGLIYGNPGQVAIEALGLGVGLTYSFVVTYILVKVINHFLPFRQVDEKPENFGEETSN